VDHLTGEAPGPGGPDHPPALLHVENLRVSYRGSGGRVEAVRGADLSVRPGEVVALVGESGSGKSTIAHSVIRMLPSGGTLDAGRIVFAGEDLAQAPERRLRALRGKSIGLIPQDPMASLNPVLRIGRQVQEALLLHSRDEDRPQTAAAAVELLARAGLADPELRASQYPHELSGGMRQRVLIAIALAGDPRLIIADEPTSALDATVRRRVLDRIDELIHGAGTAMLLITHDLSVAADRAEQLFVLHGGQVVEHGPTEQVLGDPGHPYTRHLLASTPNRAPARTRPAAAPRDAAPGSDGTTQGSAAEPELLTVENLVKDFPLRHPGAGPRRIRAVDQVSFTVGRGETFALVGESGSGKSTTARLLTRLTEPTGGRILLDGRDITSLRGERLRQIRRHVQLVYQNPYTSLDPRFTVAQIVQEPLRAFRVGSRAARRARTQELVDQVALPAGVLRRKPAELSGGQRQRVAIARALALEPRLLICDEAVSALDVSVQAQILDLLVRLQAELGLSYLFISHDLAVVRWIADRVGVMYAGRLVETGPCETIFADPRHEYAQELLAACAPMRPGPLPAP
jgi:peptide/nickel transport system ATP-binding protein